MKNMNHLIAFHSDADGVTSAAAAYQGLRAQGVNAIQMEFVPVNYSKTDLFWNQFNNAVRLRLPFHVHVLDFSFSGAEFKRILESATALTWIDHHIGALDNALEKDDTAMLMMARWCVNETPASSPEDQAVLDRALAVTDSEQARKAVVTHGDLTPKVGGVFNPYTAACVLAWEHYTKHVPEFAKYVGDRDTWKFALQFSKEINIAIRMRFLNFRAPYWFPLVLDVAQACDNMSEENKATYRTLGTGVTQYLDQVAKSMSTKVSRLCLPGVNATHTSGGYCVPAVFLSGFGEDYHEIAHQMLDNAEVWGMKEVQERKVLAVLHPSGAKWVVSFQSIPGCAEDSTALEFAKLLGGSGHKHAAGAVVPFNKMRNRFDVFEIQP